MNNDNSGVHSCASKGETVAEKKKGWIESWSLTFIFGSSELFQNLGNANPGDFINLGGLAAKCLFFLLSFVGHRFQ